MALLPWDKNNLLTAFPHYAMHGNKAVRGGGLTVSSANFILRADMVNGQLYVDFRQV